MFKNEYQGGAYFEVFSAQGKDPISNWKLTGAGYIKKTFDKEVKSFIFCLEGGTATTKMQLPKDPKHSLALIQRYLVLQVNVPKGCDFCIDLGVTDLHNTKRRLALSTTYKEIQTNPLHGKIPLAVLRRHKWLNLCVDLVSLMDETWRGQTYKSIESICISANCKLRRIFTMRAQLADSTDDDELYGITGTNATEIDSIPRQCQLAPDISQLTQVINMKKVRCFESKGKPADTIHGSSEVDLNSSGGRRAMQENYHIAFGTKVAGSGQPRKSSAGKDGNATVRQQRSEHSRSRSDTSGDVSASSHSECPQRYDEQSRKHTDTHANGDGVDKTDTKSSSAGAHRGGAGGGGDGGKDDVRFVQPHPPREPSSDRVRRKPRVKSAGHRSAHGVSDSSNASSRVSSAGSSSLISNSSSCQSNQIQPTRDIDVINYLSGGDESISELIDTLKYQHSEGELTDTLKASRIDEQFTENDIEQMANDRIYTFSSPPKCVTLCRDNDMTDKTNMLHRPRVKKKSPTQRTTHHPHSDFRNDSPSLTDHHSSMQHMPSTHHRPVLQGGLVSPSPVARPSTETVSKSRLSISKKSLREISRQELQQSVSLKPYDSSKYELAEMSDSFEARMLETLRQQALNGASDSSDDGENGDVGSKNEKSMSRFKYATTTTNEAGSGSSDDDEDMGMKKDEDAHRKPNHHNYQDEMKSFNNDFLTQSNPREWGSVFSPPIVLPSTIQNDGHTQLTNRTTTEIGTNNNIKPKVAVLDVKEMLSDEEDELDLLYDRVLNCFYDPKTCKYYELM